MCQSDYFLDLLSPFYKWKELSEKVVFLMFTLEDPELTYLINPQSKKKSCLKLGLEWITGHCFQISFLRFEILKCLHKDIYAPPEGTLCVTEEKKKKDCFSGILGVGLFCALK